MERMEIFKKNLEEASFTTDFIIQALNYFNELEDEKEANDFYNKVEEVIDDYNRCGSFTFNTIQSELNLKDFRGDIAKLGDCDTNNILDFSKYFVNIEEFEIQILYCLYYEFYPITLNFIEMKNFIQNNRSKKNKKKYNGLLRSKL